MNLSELGLKHGTDKGNVWHTAFGSSYLDIYDRYLSKMRLSPINLLELGVRDGASLRMWREYFPYGTITGVDINPECLKHKSEGIDIIIASQNDGKAIQGEFDIIIDDASHVNELTIKSFNSLFPKVKSDGFYIIEDLHTSYLDLTEDVKSWPGMSYNDQSLSYKNNRNDLNWLFNRLIHRMDSSVGDIKGIFFHSMMAIINKI